LPTILLALLFVAVCGSSAAGSSEDKGGGAAATDGTLTTAAAAAMIDEVSAAVAELRGLEFRQAVTVQVIDDDAAREHVIQRIDAFMPAEQLEAVERAYGLLGLLPPGTDILQAYLDAMREQAGGFYDPQTKSFYLLDDIPAGMGPMLASHELTHALEDQHFDIDGRLLSSIDNDDRLFALSAVHEGSATLLMTVFVMQQTMRGELDPASMLEYAESEAMRAEVLHSLPELIRRQLMAPYMLGAGFFVDGNVFAAVGGGYPQEKVDRAYAASPLSSEQILHPERYWDEARRDDPRPVSLGDVGAVLGPEWQRSFGGVLGEISLGLMVGAPTPDDFGALDIYGGDAWTNAAATGWDGDRWELWLRGDDAVALLGTVWDGPEDAREFAAALGPRDGLAWKVSGDRVAVVAGSPGKKTTKRLLRRMLAAAPPLD
jgi:hypothetical protein